jgi:phytoene desaturase
MSQSAVVVGAGFSGLSAASLLLKQGYSVTVLEKNDSCGGRAREWKTKGYTFDMGPSWYLMPEVFDDFFNGVGKKREDYFTLKRLSTYYKVFFEDADPVEVHDDLEETKRLFDSFEPLGGKRLSQYLDQAKFKYEVAMQDFLYKEYRSIFQFFNRRLITEGLKLHIFKGLDAYVEGYFKDRRAKQLLEYAMVFLGTSPTDAPALYSLMSHVDMNLGVYYPQGGLAGAADGFRRLAEELGARILTGKEVSGYEFSSTGKITGVRCGDESYPADLVVNSADYHHADAQLLPEKRRRYSPGYWKRRVVAPSMFIIYLGIKRRLKGFAHHNLYFAKDWNIHFDTIFKKPAWPENPCFYLSCNSKTDPSSAPEGSENVFILVPVAAGMADSDEVRESYAETVLKHIEKVSGEDLHSDVEVKRIYSHRDFSGDYNAYRGTALGLSHTLFQTAVFRPSHRSRKIPNLFYTGQFTHPGVGVPMTLISSRVVAEEIEKVGGGSSK